MKKIISLLMLTLSVSISAMANEATQQLTVTGMTCKNCAASIKKALLKNPEVKDVTVDVKSGKVVLTFNPEKTLTEAQIRESVKGAGFEVKSVAHTSDAKPQS